MIFDRPISARTVFLRAAQANGGFPPSSWPGTRPAATFRQVAQVQFKYFGAVLGTDRCHDVSGGEGQPLPVGLRLAETGRAGHHRRAGPARRLPRSAMGGQDRFRHRSRRLAWQSGATATGRRHSRRSGSRSDEEHGGRRQADVGGARRTLDDSSPGPHADRHQDRAGAGRRRWAGVRQAEPRGGRFSLRPFPDAAAEGTGAGVEKGPGRASTSTVTRPAGRTGPRRFRRSFRPGAATI